MNTLTALFQTILNMSVAASIVAAVVMIMRLPLKKAPKIFSYVLWVFVFIRLVLPFSFTSQVSVLSVAGPSITDQGRVQFVVPSTDQSRSSIPHPLITSGQTAGNPSGFQPDSNGTGLVENTELPSPSDTNQPSAPSDTAGVLPVESLTGTEEPAVGMPESTSSPLLRIVSVIWVVGMLGYAGLLIANSLALRHRLRYAMRVKHNIYECEAITSPFIYGLLYPKIYLPMDLEPSQRKYVLTHERVHLRRYDYVFKMIGSLLLMVHWFNPILWYSYILMSKDMEMACDEAVLQRLGRSGRVNYGMTLLQFASKPTITALSFSESNTKLRIKNILNYKKPTFWMLAIGIAACLLLAVPLLSNPAFGKDQREIDALLNEAEAAQIESVNLAVNLNEPYNQYQWSLVPMMNQDLVIVIGEQNLERKITVAYDFKNDEVKAAYLQSTAWGAEQCAGLGDLFYHLFVDEYVIPEAMNNVNLALGEYLTSVDYCTEFEPLGPISLKYGSNSDQMIVEFQQFNEANLGQLVYDKTSGQVLLNTAADQMTVPESFWDEFVGKILLYDQQQVVQKSTCAVLEDGRFSCPSIFASLPMGASQVAPLVAWNEEYPVSEDYGVIGWDLTDDQTEDRDRIPVLAMAEGVIREMGEDEQGRRYIILDHPELGISAFYGGLADTIYRETGETIFYPGQLLGYLSSDNVSPSQRPALHFAVMAGGELVDDLTPYLQYAMSSPVKINAFEIQDLTFEIDENKLALIDAIVAESRAYEEYNEREPMVDRQYAQQRDISITAQPTDFPTLLISQELGSNKLYVDRSYRINETLRNVIPGVDGNFLITVNFSNSPTSGHHTTYECHVFFPELSVWLNTNYDPLTGRYSTIELNIDDEALLEASYAAFDELNGRILRTDERVLALSEQLIQVITDEQPADYTLIPLARMFEE